MKTLYDETNSLTSVMTGRELAVLRLSLKIAIDSLKKDNEDTEDTKAYIKIAEKLQREFGEFTADSSDGTLFTLCRLPKFDNIKAVWEESKKW